jgi:heptosyltransferase-2
LSAQKNYKEHFRKSNGERAIVNPGRTVQLLKRVLANPAAMAAPIRKSRELLGWRPRKIPLGKARNILVIRPDEIGDVVLTGPFLRELRMSAPLAHITLVVKRLCQELVEHCPYVNEVYSLDFISGRNNSRRLVATALRLRWCCLPLHGFDIVLLPRRGNDYYFSENVAYVLAGRGNILFNKELRADPQCTVASLTEGGGNLEVEHELIYNLRFLRRCLEVPDASNTSLECWLTDEDRNFARATLSAAHRYVAFATGATAPARQWPIERFVAVATQLRDLYGTVPVFLGAAGEPGFSEGVNLIGRTTLRQAAAVLEHCGLFVGNDSGPKHIAAAVGVPVVEISAFRVGGDVHHPNSPARFHAWGVPYRLAQPPRGVGNLAIEEVAVNDVVRLCTELMCLSCKSLEQRVLRYSKM